jgi:hypothetical protein
MLVTNANTTTLLGDNPVMIKISHPVRLVTVRVSLVINEIMTTLLVVRQSTVERPRLVVEILHLAELHTETLLLTREIMTTQTLVRPIMAESEISHPAATQSVAKMIMTEAILPTKEIMTIHVVKQVTTQTLTRATMITTTETPASTEHHPPVESGASEEL